MVSRTVGVVVFRSYVGCGVMLFAVFILDLYGFVVYGGVRMLFSCSFRRVRFVFLA